MEGKPIPTWDFIDDAVDSLNKDGCQYVLLVGKEGFNRTEIFGGVNSAKDAQMFVSAMMKVMKAKFPDCADFQF